MATLIGNLGPRWLGVLREGSGEGVSFDCPACKKEHRPHIIVLYFDNPVDGGPCAEWLRDGRQQSWKRLGGEGMDLRALSARPSFRYDCFHGWLENGRVVSVQESPLVVNAQAPGMAAPGPLALSPMQTLHVCRVASARAKVLLGGREDDAEPPPAVWRREGGGGWLSVGGVDVRFWPGDGEPGPEAARMIEGINAYAGRLSPADVEVGRVETPPQREAPPSIVLPGGAR